jgi:hypothetical protein
MHSQAAKVTGRRRPHPTPYNNNDTKDFIDQKEQTNEINYIHVKYFIYLFNLV